MRTVLHAAVVAALALAAPAPAGADEHAVSGRCDVVVVKDSELGTVGHLTLTASATVPDDVPLVYAHCVVVAPDGSWAHETWAGGVGHAAGTDLVGLPGIGYRACMYSSAWYLAWGDGVASADGCHDL